MKFCLPHLTDGNNWREWTEFRPPRPSFAGHCRSSNCFPGKPGEKWKFYAIWLWKGFPFTTLHKTSLGFLFIARHLWSFVILEDDFVTLESCNTRRVMTGKFVRTTQSLIDSRAWKLSLKLNLDSRKKIKGNYSLNPASEARKLNNSVCVEEDWKFALAATWKFIKARSLIIHSSHCSLATNL